MVRAVLDRAFFWTGVYTEEQGSQIGARMEVFHEGDGPYSRSGQSMERQPFGH